MGSISYCDWCKEELHESHSVQYDKQLRDTFRVSVTICKTCNDKHTKFVESVDRDRKPRLCYDSYEEITLSLIKDGKAHTLMAIIKHLKMAYASNIPHTLDALVSKDMISKGNCPKCGKRGYYDIA